MKPILQKCLLLLCLAALPWAAHAVDKNVQDFPNPEMEARYKVLIEELRCVVCQNQALADSNAELAQDLRDEVRKMLLAGQSNEAIKNFLVERYGDFVLYRPPVKNTTMLLWLGPLLLLILALATMTYFIRRQSRPAAQPTPLNEAEQETLRKALQDND